jgi:hypothetical protein
VKPLTLPPQTEAGQLVPSVGAADGHMSDRERVSSRARGADGRPGRGIFEIADAQMEGERTERTKAAEGISTRPVP